MERSHSLTGSDDADPSDHANLTVAHVNRLRASNSGRIDHRTLLAPDAAPPLDSRIGDAVDGTIERAEYLRHRKNTFDTTECH